VTIVNEKQSEDARRKILKRSPYETHDIHAYSVAIEP